MATILISLAGLQPSATAVALKTWLNLQGAPRPDSVWLLATSEVRGQASRLTAFCNTLRVRSEIISVRASLEPGSRLKTIPEALREALAAVQPPVRAIYYGDPGLTVLGLAAAQVLPPDAVFLHTDSEHLYWMTRSEYDEKWARTPLRDLGMTDFLELYDLQVKSEPWRMNQGLQRHLQNGGVAIGPDLLQGVRFLAGEALPVLELAYERRGRFYGLCLIEGVPDWARARTRSLTRMAVELKNLRPALAVLSRQELVLTRARSSGFESIDWNDMRKLRRWVSGRTTPPGYAAVGDAEVPPGPLASAEGRGGRFRPLAVWMGADPSATLVSLFTHKPREAWILYDSQSPAVKEMTRRLQECLADIPVGTALFVPSDRLGRGILGQLSQVRSLKADVSPGTKMQSYALAQIPKAELWSLHTRENQAVRLGGGVKLPLCGPDLLTQLRVCGGRLEDPGEDVMAWPPDYRQFLILLGRCLAATLTERGIRRFDPLPQVECSRGSVRVFPGANGEDRVEVRFEDQWASGIIRGLGGWWLEKVAASALAAAGADEVRVNVRWAWPDGAARDEADVVAKFGHRFLVASCKLRRHRRGPNRPVSALGDDLALQTQEVEAVALSCVGHQAIPLTIRPRLAPGLVSSRMRVRQGAAYLDLGELFVKPLSSTLERIWSARSRARE